MFRQYPGSGSFGGQVWGTRCIFFTYSRTAIWVIFAKQEGHQIASTITTCTRTDEEPCIAGPLCSCTDTDLCGTLLPAGRSNLGGSPRAQSYMVRPDLTDTDLFETLLPAGRSNFGGFPRAQSYMIRPDLVDTGIWRFWRDAASRSDPTFTRASLGLRS